MTIIFKVKIPIITDPAEEKKTLIENRILLDKKNIFTIRRASNLDYVLALITRRQFNCVMTNNDYEQQGEVFHIKVTEGGKTESYTTPMTTTIDGYLIIGIQLVLTKEVKIELLFGLNYEWVQIDTFDLFGIEGINAEISAHISDKMTLNQMRLHGKNIYECLFTDSSLKISLDSAEINTLKIVFRPLISRNFSVSRSNITQRIN